MFRSVQQIRPKQRKVKDSVCTNAQSTVHNSCFLNYVLQKVQKGLNPKLIHMVFVLRTKWNTGINKKSLGMLMIWNLAMWIPKSIANYQNGANKLMGVMIWAMWKSWGEKFTTIWVWLWTLLNKLLWIYIWSIKSKELWGNSLTISNQPK